MSNNNKTVMGAALATAAVINSAPSLANMSEDDLMKAIENLEEQGKTLYQSVHQFAVASLSLAAKGHNYTTCSRLVKAVDNFKGSRPKALIKWMETFGPMLWDTETKQFKRNPDKTEYEVTRANGTPYWVLTPEPKIQTIDLESTEESIAKLVKRLRADTTNFKRDPKQIQDLEEVAASLERLINPVIQAKIANLTVKVENAAALEEQKANIAAEEQAA